VAAGTTITHGRTSWGSSTLALSNDPMTDIKWPGKLDAAAKQTLENARATGRRFIKTKYDLRNKVLSACYDYALNAELIRLEQSNQQLLRTTAMVTEARNRAGTSGQQEVLKASNEVDVSGNDIANMESQLASQRAREYVSREVEELRTLRRQLTGQLQSVSSKLDDALQRLSPTPKEGDVLAGDRMKFVIAEPDPTRDLAPPVS